MRGTSGEVDSEDETDNRGNAARQAHLGAADVGLSPAQWRVFELLVEGFGEKQIATRLQLSHHTVHNHVRGIYTRYSVHSRAEFLALLLQRQRGKAPPT
jgi:DNA-binding NarL/FixJ family response regulator